MQVICAFGLQSANACCELTTLQFYRNISIEMHFNSGMTFYYTGTIRACMICFIIV